MNGDNNSDNIDFLNFSYNQKEFRFQEEEKENSLSDGIFPEMKDIDQGNLLKNKTKNAIATERVSKKRKRQEQDPNDYVGQLFNALKSKKQLKSDDVILCNDQYKISEELLSVLLDIKSIFTSRPQLEALIKEAKARNLQEMKAIIKDAKELGILSSITGMQYGKGMITKENFEQLKELSTVDGQFDKRVLKSITGMQAKKGMITKANFEQLKELCTVDGQFDKTLLSSISGMQNGKGMIARKDFEQLKELCTINRKLDTQVLKSITGMQHGKGMIAKKDLEQLKELCTVNGKLDKQLLSSITGMQSGRGMISTADFTRLKELCTVDGKLDRQVLKSVTGMQAKKGMISKEDFEQLKELCTVNGKLDKQLLSSITGMQNGRGMVTKENLTRLKELCTTVDGQLDKQLLSVITGIQSGRGAPNLKKLAYCLKSDVFKDLIKKNTLSNLIEQFNKGKEPINIILTIIIHIEALHNKQDLNNDRLYSTDNQFRCPKLQQLIDELQLRPEIMNNVQDSSCLLPTSPLNNHSASNQDQQDSYIMNNVQDSSCLLPTSPLNNHSASNQDQQVQLSEPELELSDIINNYSYIFNDSSDNGSVFGDLYNHNLSEEEEKLLNLSSNQNSTRGTQFRRDAFNLNDSHRSRIDDFSDL